MDDVTRAVARQYSDFAYPKPIVDMAAAQAGGSVDLCDPTISGSLIWPEGAPPEDRDILIAGCGTQQAAWIAFTNPQARVVGVDLSEASLAHQRFLRDRHGVRNLELFQGDLREVGKLGRSFDLVISTGVLHHLADPGEGLRALRDVLRPDGALALMVYGKVGRVGVYMLQDAFRRMGLGQDAQGVAAVRAALAGLPSYHPALGYTGRTPELVHDEALVDTFLHPQDRAYTVPELLAWLEDNGLAFQSWIENFRYYPEAKTQEPLRSTIQRLPVREQWATVEALQGELGTHTFTARLSGKAVTIDFAQPGWLDYRPKLPPGGAFEGRSLKTRGISVDVGDNAAVLLAAVDGVSTVREILMKPAFESASSAEREAFARSFLDQVWKLGALMIEAPRG